MEMDPRRQLGEAVRVLLEDRTIEEISVKEILTKAKVSRYQFYKYFHSKEELVRWEYLHILSVHARDILGSSSWSEALYKKFLVYQSNLKFFQHVYQGKDIEDLRQVNRRFVRDAYRMMLHHAGADLNNPHIIFATEMVVVGGEEMTIRWIVDGMKVPIEVMLVLFQESIPVCISQYFY
jgi:AcrR family transcriptional regulator